MDTPPSDQPDARARILEAAWRLIDERRDLSASMLEIARAAGVSRQTVYVQFGSRAGLLLAMVEHRDAITPQHATLLKVRQETDPGQALDAWVRAWFGYLPIVFEVTRALSLAASRDEDARPAFDSRMRPLRANLLAIMKDQHAAGRLARGWTPEAAADWCFHLIHPDTWQHLVIERDWNPEDVTRRTAATLKAVLLRPSASRR